MVGYLRLLAMAGAVFLAGALEAHAEKRVALVIGNSNYQNVIKLPNPQNDAGLISAVLKKANFDVVEVRHDLTGTEMRRAIRDFSDKSNDADIAVVYYAGHGIEVDGTNYLVPVDAVLERDVDVEDETIPVDRFLKLLEPVKRLRLVILDACRDNPFMRKMKRTLTTRSVGRGLARVDDVSSDTIIAFAAKAGSTASDGDGANSPFALALSKHLSSPGLDLRIAFGLVRDDVMKATRNKQEPFVYGSLGGATVSLVPAPVVDTNVETRRQYEASERVGTKEAWDSFLATNSNGVYADLARAQRTKLISAEEAAKAKAVAPGASAPVVVASAAPVAPASAVPSTPGGPAPGEIARSLQAELHRVGCFAASVDGDWNEATRKAVLSFNRNANLKLDVKVPTLEALDIVKQRTSRVCPLECTKGFKADGEQCVKIVCAEGTVLNDKGACEPAKAKTAAAPATREVSPKAAGSSGGRIHCNPHGCTEVKPGCRVVVQQNVSSSSASGGYGEFVICH